MRYAWLVLALLGCPAVGESGTSFVDDRQAPEGWAWADTGEVAALDTEVLARDIESTLGAMYTISADVPLNSFKAAYAYSTPECPASAVVTPDAQYGTTLYFDGLCFGNGMVFKGPALLYEWDHQSINPIAAMSVASALPGDIVWTGTGFNGQTDIYAQDGSRDFNCSCTMLDLEGVANDGATWFFGITQGTAHWTGPEGLGTWMEDPAVVPDFQIISNGNAQFRNVQAEGTLSGVGERYTAMVWDLQLNGGPTPDGAWTCAPDSTLALDVRDSLDSAWISLSFSVASDCQACADAPTGETVCVDLSTLHDWDGSPWH